MNKKVVVVCAVAVIIAVIGGFVLGRMSSERGNSATYPPGMVGRSRSGLSSRTMPQDRGMLRYRPTIGEVIAIDADSLTIKLADGSSKIVLFTPSTGISRVEKAKTDNIHAGSRVLVQGQSNTDGSVSASRIQIDPVDLMPSAFPSQQPNKP